MGDAVVVAAAVLRIRLRQRARRGLAARRASGLPVTSSLPAVPTTRFEARERPELQATLSDVRDGSRGCLVNALAPSVFRGEGVTSYSRPGRIPGSVNVPAGSLPDPSTGCFLPPGELRSRLEFLLDETDVVAHCGGASPQRS